MQVALCMTEAEYISLSIALRDTIPLMLMARELQEKFGIDIYGDAVNVYCHCFEDNSSALELAKLPKMRPCTKHINICYHHYREYVRQGEIKIHAINTNDQITYMLTKPLQQNLLVRHHKMLIGM